MTYANVIATLALFLALGGGAVWAAGKIGTKNLRANAVTGEKLKAGSVSFAKFAAGTNLLLSVEAKGSV